ncbi:uncharacterized protein LOC134824941 [Bolinopsis microptera]|uniref:uncharacterized protein LOC134824941 n=1 Tax=Bolinopsis microptera TaxID=2820187 RepID=UPI00307A887E
MSQLLGFGLVCATLSCCILVVVCPDQVTCLKEGHADLEWGDQLQVIAEKRAKKVVADQPSQEKQSLGGPSLESEGLKRNVSLFCVLSKKDNLNMYERMCRVYFDEEEEKGSESALKGSYTKVGCGIAESGQYVAVVCCYKK